ncbi:hypothetical protein MBLNU230_g8001t1 [Neophaeotheca triangularis]
MLGTFKNAALLLAATSPFAFAQFPPEPEGITVLRSQFDSEVTISYKETEICETTPGVRSYSGHVHLPPGTLSDLGEPQQYPINTFFWFFEARSDPTNAPLSIWMNGGPGSSSMLGLLVENGPCFVNADSNSTYLNEWSWVVAVNMLYLDQPVQVGLSYDTLQNVTTNLLTGEVTVLNATDPIPEQNATFLVGTYPSQDGNQTAEGSVNAAIALWHFAQVWFQEFPGYSPNDSRISIATESYGGRYGPAFAAFFEEQDMKIQNGTWDGTEGEMYILNLDTLMIVNGCLDRQVQWPSYPQIAFNNTYGIEAVNETVFNQMNEAYYMDGGCRDQINDCRALAREFDPENRGINETVNEVCEAAESFCSEGVRDPYLLYSGRNYYDIATFDPDPFPAPFYQGFLNQPHVQAAMGVPLNWTQSSGTVAAAFRGIGDYPRPGWLEDLAYLLESGIKVNLMYGDRDFACNWLGGEAVSLAINYTNTEQFAAAGYEGIQTNASYIGGQVRQYGNLSFTRVYEAGHEVPSYQPETAYAIFMRALFNKDIATGQINTAEGEYATQGPSDTRSIMNEDPPQPLEFCYVLDPGATCSAEQIESLLDGTAEVERYILVDANSTKLFPDVVGTGKASGNATSNGTMPVSPTPSAYTGGAGGLRPVGLAVGAAVALLGFLL